MATAKKKKACRGVSVKVARNEYRCHKAKGRGHRIVCCHVPKAAAARKPRGVSKAQTKRHESLFQNFDPTSTGPMEGLRRRRKSRKSRR